MINYVLNEEEQEILAAFEDGTIQPIPNAKEDMAKHREYAAATFRKDKTINIRLTSHDLSTDRL